MYVNFAKTVVSKHDTYMWNILLGEEMLGREVYINQFSDYVDQMRENANIGFEEGFDVSTEHVRTYKLGTNLISSQF